MVRILVPVDFSPTSLNAASYAVRLGKVIGSTSVTLLSVVSSGITGSDGTPVADDPAERNRAVLESLEMVQVALYNEAGVPTEIQLREGDFAELLPVYIREHQFDFVVMGVTGSSALEQVFGTSNAVEVIARSNTPVVVVPPQASFSEIKDVALAVELQNIVDHIPLSTVKNWLDWLKPRVHITHVNKGATTELTLSEQSELEKLKDALILYQPVVHVLAGEKFTDALNHIAVDESIDLLITFPKRHSFFDLLFRSTHTRQLVFHSQVPVLALPHE